MFKKILIANRGEIAVRVIRACRELHVRTVAVYSDADVSSLHVQKADEAFRLGESAPSESYLNIPKIIALSKKIGVDAIHPGYGFLSENANFAEACEQSGIVFIGPKSSVIRQMGDKIGARNFLKKHGVPLVPGTDESLRDLKDSMKWAKEIGYPVLLKAAAGGGGKGMKVVREEKDLAEALESCRRIAGGAFGDDRIFMEKYIESPRHVEFQIVADHHGNVIHLFERECSIQRRHQKIIEETPSPALDEKLRKKMGDVAVKIGKLIGYTSVGTIEFVLDRDKNFYFLEVNTRLQVEHPITEMVMGVDLVRMQIEIAEGKSPLAPLFQRGESRDIPLCKRGNEGDFRLAQVGHAIECRIYAEDPENQFLPSPGKITFLHEPTGEGVRVDSGIYEGWTVPFEYDPMLAKLIVHAPTRERAIVKMLTALAEYQVGGIKTNIPFLIDLLRHPDVLAGHTETGLIEKKFQNWAPSKFIAEDPFNPWMSAISSSPLPSRERARVRGSVHAIIHDPVAPMPGKVMKVLVREGQSVKQGDPLVVVEAMKMEHSIDASHDGTVIKVFFKTGDTVGMGERLVELSDD